MNFVYLFDRIDRINRILKPAHTSRMAVSTHSLPAASNKFCIANAAMQKIEVGFCSFESHLREAAETFSISPEIGNRS